jgi:hypothetical protein
MTADQVRSYGKHLFDRRDMDFDVWFTNFDPFLEERPFLLARFQPRVVIARAEYLSELRGP